MDSVLFSLCFFQNLPLSFGKNTRLQRPIARIFPRSSPPSQTFAPRLPPRLPIDTLLRRLVRAPDYPAIPPFSPGSAARSSCGGTPRRRTDRRSHQSSPAPPPPAPHGTGPMGAPFLFIQTAEVNSAVCKVLSPTKRLYGASAPPHLRWGPYGEAAAALFRCLIILWRHVRASDKPPISSIKPSSTASSP